MLLIVIALVAYWLGPGLQHARKRVTILEDPHIVAIDTGNPRIAAFARITAAKALPMSWRLFGAKPLHMVIWLSGDNGENTPPDGWDHVEDIFPEAEIQAQPR